jgi:hypothetical protein
MSMSEPFVLSLEEIQPSQLYINHAKLAKVQAGSGSLAPLPVKRLGGRVVLTDGHTRALVAWQAGRTHIEVYWDRDELDWEAYEICVAWCDEAGIRTAADLASRVVTPEVYEMAWLQRCARMQRALAERRRSEQRRV